MTVATRLILLSGLALNGCAMPAPTPPPTPPPAPEVASVRIIVEVKPAPGVPRVVGIKRSQDQVIASLATGRATVVNRYTNLPMLALEVDPAMVETLRQNPLVVSVQPDEKRTLQVK